MIQLTNQQAIDLYNFIRASLERAWDRYTSFYICEMQEEEGLRYMNPQMYDFAEELAMKIDEAGG